MQLQAWNLENIMQRLGLKLKFRVVRLVGYESSVRLGD